MTSTVFAADLHLLPGEQPRQNAALEKFLREVKNVGATRLVLLGDAFNWWFERCGKTVGDYEECLRLFAETARQGIQILHVSGNRDFMIGAGNPDDAAAYRGFFRGRPAANAISAMAKFGGISPRGFSCRFTQDDETVFCTHGDMYAIADPAHGMMRWWTMSLPMRLYFAFAPFPILRFLFNFLQNRDTVPYRRLLPRARLIEPETLSPLADLGVRHFFCGHFHADYRALNVPTKNAPALLHIIPCWRNHGAFAILTNRQVEIIRGEF